MLPTAPSSSTPLLASDATEEQQPQQQVTDQAKADGQCLLDSATGVSSSPSAAMSLQERELKILDVMAQIEILRVRAIYYNNDNKNFSEKITVIMTMVLEVVYLIGPVIQKLNYILKGFKIAHDLFRKEVTTTGVLCAKHLNFVKSLVSAPESAGPVSEEYSALIKAYQKHLIRELMGKTIDGKPWGEITSDIDTRGNHSLALQVMEFIIALLKVSVYMQPNKSS